MPPAFLQLREEISDFVASPGEGLGDLFLQIFRFQFATNAPYRAYCTALGRPPELVPRWQEIPPVPAEAFKTGLPLTCLPPEECERVFHTSGTTGETRGRHYLADLHLYKSSVQAGWIQAGLPSGLRSLFLSQNPAAIPESSLACMFQFLADDTLTEPWLLSGDGSVSLAPLEAAIAEGQPLLLFATALSLRHLLGQFPGGLPLPPGSWLFQTGGYKGLSESYRPEALYADIESRLAIPSQRVINEYGMTELSSQSYALGLDTPHRSPPWMKVQVLDPESNAALPPGKPGYLCFTDLANLNSVLAVRTRDFGTAVDEHTFFLHGRDPGASPRGCSRASDAYLQRS